MPRWWLECWMQPMASSSWPAQPESIQVLQYIASSLLGARSFSGGLASAGLGLVLHFAVSLVVATIYILASRHITVLRTQWVLLGLLYGMAVWSVMNLVFLPHTASVNSTLTAAALANGLIGHALFVGLPNAFSREGGGGRTMSEKQVIVGLSMRHGRVAPVGTGCCRCCVRTFQKNVSVRPTLGNVSRVGHRLAEESAEEESIIKWLDNRATRERIVDQSSWQDPRYRS